MATTVTLHDDICDFLEKEVAEKFTLKTLNINGSKSFKHPQVIRSGFIMPKSIDGVDSEDEEFPFLLPRIHRVENVKNERQSTATLDVLFGVYDPGVYDENGKLVDDGSGYRDFWNLIESTRQAFFAAHTIAKKYRIADDFFEANMNAEQIYPYWEGWCRTRWHIVYPRPQLQEHLF
ncbi:MAG: hypothetical protein FWC66_08485 [Oscillospiraceae bacterium]|nr:hypothetical protein [Oscillospiraceae bacterium]